MWAFLPGVRMRYLQVLSFFLEDWGSVGSTSGVGSAWVVWLGSIIGMFLGWEIKERPEGEFF